MSANERQRAALTESLTGLDLARDGDRGEYIDAVECLLRTARGMELHDLEIVLRDYRSGVSS